MAMTENEKALNNRINDLENKMSALYKATGYVFNEDEWEAVKRESPGALPVTVNVDEWKLHRLGDALNMVWSNGSWLKVRR